MSGSSGNILLADDDAAIRRALAVTLNTFDFSVHPACNGEEALASARGNQFDAVLLDVNMPGMGGIDACRELRQLYPSLPVLMLTVRDSQDDVIRALDAGADDYITKPFHIRELTARLRAAVRRNRSPTGGSAELTVGEICLDAARRTVKKRDSTIRLTPKEFDLLHYLMKHAGMPVDHSKLLRAVWGPEYGRELEYLRTFVRQLRLKIEDNPSRPVYLLTDAYVGYRFSEPTPEVLPTKRTI